MQIFYIVTISLFFLFQELKGQPVLSDTLPITVDLTKFQPREKIVKAEYGKVIMYFNQIDYLGTETAADTVRVTPKYFDERAISRLLKKGQVRIWRRSTKTFLQTFNHRLEDWSAMGVRIFEFEYGKSFFFLVERRYSLIHDIVWADSLQEKKKIVPKREFAYKEESPDFTDKTAIKIRDYFPVEPCRYYVYNDIANQYGETDTNQCRVSKLQGYDIFYFAECYSKFSIISIGTKMFGSGIYFYRNDSLFTIDANYEKDIPKKELKNAVLLLPDYMKPGDSVVSATDRETTVITYLSRDDLQIKNTLHKDCIKLKIIDSYRETVYISYVWLKKGVGMIKWMRSSGRIDELLDHYMIHPNQ